MVLSLHLGSPPSSPSEPRNSLYGHFASANTSCLSPRVGGASVPKAKDNPMTTELCPFSCSHPEPRAAPSPGPILSASGSRAQPHPFPERRLPPACPCPSSQQPRPSNMQLWSQRLPGRGRGRRATFKSCPTEGGGSSSSCRSCFGSSSFPQRVGR